MRRPDKKKLQPPQIKNNEKELSTPKAVTPLNRLSVQKTRPAKSTAVKPARNSAT